MARNPVWVQQDFQFFNDDGTLEGASSIAAINTPINRVVTNTNTFRVRLNFGDTNNATQNNSRSVKLQFQLNGGTWTDVGSATTVKYQTSTVENEPGTGTTQLLNAIVGSTYTGAEFDESATLTTRTWADTYWEYAFNINLTGVSIGDTINLRAVTSSNEVPTITNTPSITVVAEQTFIGYTHSMIF